MPRTRCPRQGTCSHGHIDTDATLDRWAVIATDVNDNVKYRYSFKSSRSVTALTAD